MLELNKIHLGECLELIKKMEDCSVDSIVTDPPYEIGFMQNEWDKSGISFKEELWSECLRVLKHGGYLVSFGATKTYHRMVCSIEDAGFEIRDQIQWLYGSGMPKSVDVSRKIDEKLGHSRGKYDDPITNEAIKFKGYGSGLKPSNEPIVLARKPLKEKTLVSNILIHGTGGLNIDSSRVPYEKGGDLATNPSLRKTINGGNGGKILSVESERRVVIPNEIGRFPTNTIIDDSMISTLNNQARSTIENEDYDCNVARFFYCPKPKGKAKNDFNNHPTVKPLQLMEYLVKLVTPLDGTVLDPFSGSGSTLISAKLNGFKFIGFEMNPDYVQIALKRLTLNT